MIVRCHRCHKCQLTATVSVIFVNRCHRTAQILAFCPRRIVIIDMAEDSPTSSGVVNSGPGSPLTSLPEPTPSPAASDVSDLELETGIDVCKRLITAMVDSCKSNDRLLEKRAAQNCLLFTIIVFQFAVLCLLMIGAFVFVCVEVV